VSAPHALPFPGVILNGLRAVKDLVRIGRDVNSAGGKVCDEDHTPEERPVEMRARSFTRLKPGSG
jgi:hypothetical protein